MATVEDRYRAATDYVRRAIVAVENAPSTINLVDRYAAQLKTQPARNELARIEGAWLRATTDFDRARVARSAELLADHVKENLPGAPLDWQRTNLFPGEDERTTPATTFGSMFADEASGDWQWLKSKTTDAANAGAGIVRLAVLAGGLVLGFRLVDYLRTRQQHAMPANDALNAALEHVAAESDEATR